jgi:hypothetical protein
MLRRAQGIFAVALLAGLALFYAREIWKSSERPHSPKYEASASQPNKNTAKSNPLYDAWEWATHDAITVYTFFLALFTAALVCVSAVQIRYLIRADVTARRAAIAARRSALAARKSAEHIPRVERAYVSGGALVELEITGSQLVPGVGSTAVTHPRWLLITVDNYGKTPAYVSHIAYSICAAEELPEPVNLARDYERSKMLVNFNVGPGTAGMRTNQRREFSQAAGKIVYGRFYYTDIFGDQHSSGFILRVTPSGDTVAFDAPPEFTTRD